MPIDVFEDRTAERGPMMTREGRLVMHQHLQDVLTSLIADDVATATRRSRSSPQLPADLLAKHLASTFVLVLNWWLESEKELTPQDVDARFRALVLPTLAMHG